ncbi:hypothetical protein BJV78DRAFT_1258520 [Lactifluus subvellereus]|nr:hypothetical protein BJV78DRAFT_1258520 [Lactifluus subvellereus]
MPNPRCLMPSPPLRSLPQQYFLVSQSPQRRHPRVGAGAERSLSPPWGMRRSISVNSLGGKYGKGGDSGAEKATLVVLESAPPAVADFDDTAGDVEEEAYGEAIESVRLTELRTDGRPRGSSFAPSTSSLSPILSRTRHHRQAQRTTDSEETQLAA